MNPMAAMAALAATGKLALQRCITCGTTQYPPRELCGVCLGDRLAWRVTDAEIGDVVAVTELHHSHDAIFRNSLPLRIGLVQLGLGPTAVCFLADGCASGTRVRVTAHNDTAGRSVLRATAIP